MYLVLSALTSSPISLAAATKASAFSYCCICDDKMQALCPCLGVATFKYYFAHLTNLHSHLFDDVNENSKASRSCSIHYPVDSVKIHKIISFICEE